MTNTRDERKAKLEKILFDESNVDEIIPMIERVFEPFLVRQDTKEGETDTQQLIDALRSIELYGSEMPHGVKDAATSMKAIAQRALASIPNHSSQHQEREDWKKISQELFDFILPIMQTATAWKPEKVQKWEEIKQKINDKMSPVRSLTPPKEPESQTDVDYWRRECYKAKACEDELTSNYFEALTLLDEAKDLTGTNSNFPARVKSFLDGETNHRKSIKAANKFYPDRGLKEPETKTDELYEALRRANLWLDECEVGSKAEKAANIISEALENHHRKDSSDNQGGETPKK